MSSTQVMSSTQGSVPTTTVPATAPTVQYIAIITDTYDKLDVPVIVLLSPNTKITDDIINKIDNNVEAFHYTDSKRTSVSGADKNMNATDFIAKVNEVKANPAATATTTNIDPDEAIKHENTGIYKKIKDNPEFNLYMWLTIFYIFRSDNTNLINFLKFIYSDVFIIDNKSLFIANAPPIIKHSLSQLFGQNTYGDNDKATALGFTTDNGKITNKPALLEKLIEHFTDKPKAYNDWLTPINNYINNYINKYINVSIFGGKQKIKKTQIKSKKPKKTRTKKTRTN